jgi:hypothetical protein
MSQLSANTSRSPSGVCSRDRSARSASAVSSPARTLDSAASSVQAMGWSMECSLRSRGETRERRPAYEEVGLMMPVTLTHRGAPPA